MRRGPAQLAAGLSSWRSLDRPGMKEVNEEMEMPRGRAPHLVQSDGPHVGGAIARLLEELAPRGVLKALVPLDVAAGQKPRARERSGGLLDDQDAPGVIDARDDRTDPRPSGHLGYGFLVGEGEGGSVALGRGLVGAGLGVRVGAGVRVGVGDGEGVRHGSGPTRFHV